MDWGHLRSGHREEMVFEVLDTSSWCGGRLVSSLEEYMIENTLVCSLYRFLLSLVTLEKIKGKEMHVNLYYTLY